MSVRLKVVVRGAVQGVGFRPFVYRLATGAGLNGWVSNSSQGVNIEAEGPQAALQGFLLRLEAEKPPISSIQSLEASWLDPLGYAGFEIRKSQAGGERTVLVLPDIATCPDCVNEIFDPHNRRYHYPFTNCTNCGPRFSIIESLPYDRANTSMKDFGMCAQCEAEYHDPRNRRFHAQPNACSVCGPRLELRDRKGNVLSTPVKGAPDLRGAHGGDRGALQAAAEAIRCGKIVAVKGLGGFHLMVMAQNDEAVGRLRELKHREEKPFALMLPSLEGIKQACEVSPLEERLLRSPEAPIVLLRRRQDAQRTPQPALSSSIAPSNSNLGVMLPYTPLHHLLLSALGFPVVATSGNLSDEPICTDEQDALGRLGGIADLFLVHNRPILRHVDDSIVRVMMGRELVLRRARGYAPLPIECRAPISNRQLGNRNAVLAVGAHLKNCIALSVGPQVFISQHIGDLETEQSFEAFRRVIADFQKLYDCQPAIIAADAHPDYLSSKFARDLVSRSSRDREVRSDEAQPAVRDPQLITVQHHIAHVLGCMAENDLDPPALGVSWDGTGYGLDGTVWGGEFFLVTETACERLAHLRQFRLIGGAAAVKEPRRTALGLLYEMLGEATFSMTDLAPVRAFLPAELGPLKKMLERRLNSPLTSSAGRLFDAVASLVGLRQEVRFEGQAAMELEFALEGIETDEAYPLLIAAQAPPAASHPSSVIVRQSSVISQQPPVTSPPILLDWSPMIEAIMADLKASVPVGQISARFHNALVEGIIAIAKRVGQTRIVLSGGCFQNRYLTERSVRRLQAEGFRPYWHQRIPPNDGGIALGQAVAALRQFGDTHLC